MDIANFQIPSLDTYMKQVSNSSCNNVSGAANFNTGQPIQDIFTPSIQTSDDKISENEFINLYNAVYEGCKEEISKSYGGIDIIKPEIVFSDKDESPGYSFGTNTIAFPKILLSDSCIIGKDSGIAWDIDNNGFTVTKANNWVQPFEVQNILNQNPACQKATKSEKMAILASTLRHEIEHCAQIQCSLCVEGTKENFIKTTMAQFDISEEDMQIPEIKAQVLDIIKECYPFIYSYQPRTKVDENSNIAKLEAFKSNFDDFKKDFLCSTDFDNPQAYYSNINEILAREAESEFWEKHAKNLFPDISDNFKTAQKVAVDLNKTRGAILRKQLNAQK